jgi:[ribosomal protein S5]-alanine N-acetyltransferase
MSDFPLETKRLAFSVFDEADLPDLAALLSDPQVMRFTIRGVRDIAGARTVLREFQAAQQRHGFSKWALRRRDTGAFVGYCGLNVFSIDGRPEVELGYRLAVEHWRQGLATEAGRGVLEWAFRLKRLPSVVGFLDPANTASVRVLEKLGMTRRFTTTISGHVMDVYRIESPERTSDVAPS